MRGDFGLHFGAWLLISASLILFIFGFLVKPTGLTAENPARAFFYGFAVILFFSLFCSLVDFFVIPIIIRLVGKARKRRSTAP